MEKKYVIIWCSFKYVQCMEYTFGENHIIFKRGFSLKKKKPNINNYIHYNFATTLHRGQRKVKVMPNSAPIRYQMWPG